MNVTFSWCFFCVFFVSFEKRVLFFNRDILCKMSSRRKPSASHPEKVILKSRYMHHKSPIQSSSLWFLAASPIASRVMVGNMTAARIKVCEMKLSFSWGLRVYPGNTSLPITNTLNLWSVQAIVPTALSVPFSGAQNIAQKVHVVVNCFISLHYVRRRMYNL